MRDHQKGYKHDKIIDAESSHYQTVKDKEVDRKCREMKEDEHRIPERCRPEERGDGKDGVSKKEDNIEVYPETAGPEYKELHPQTS